MNGVALPNRMDPAVRGDPAQPASTGSGRCKCASEPGPDARPAPAPAPARPDRSPFPDGQHLEAPATPPPHGPSAMEWPSPQRGGLLPGIRRTSSETCSACSCSAAAAAAPHRHGPASRAGRHRRGAPTSARWSRAAALRCPCSDPLLRWGRPAPGSSRDADGPAGSAPSDRVCRHRSHR